MSDDSDTMLIERLATLMHEQWSWWMLHVLILNTAENDNGSRTIPAVTVELWRRQYRTAYAGLPDDEKEIPRARAREVIDLLDQLLSEEFGVEISPGGPSYGDQET